MAQFIAGIGQGASAAAGSAASGLGTAAGTAAPLAQYASEFGQGALRGLLGQPSSPIGGALSPGGLGYYGGGLLASQSPALSDLSAALQLLGGMGGSPQPIGPATRMAPSGPPLASPRGLISIGGKGPGS